MPGTRAQPVAENQELCPVDCTIGLIGGKWKVLLLWHLQEAGVLRFAELRRAVQGITEKMLTQQLRELEADGLITRTVYPQVPPKVEYRLTPLGRTLEPVLDTLCAWGEGYLKRTGGSPR